MGVVSFLKSLFGGSNEHVSSGSESALAGEGANIERVASTDVTSHSTESGEVPKSGYGLSADTPILLADIPQAYELLGRLRTADGKRLTMRSRYSLDPGTSFNQGLIDQYNLVDTDGASHTIFMYCYYHTDVVQAPPGYKLV